MRWVLFALILVHGLIHFAGFAKSLGLAELPLLTQPISIGVGIAWLVARLALVATAVLLSQVMVLSSWSDAKVGTVANVVVLAGVVYGFASQGPARLPRGVPAPGATPVVTTHHPCGFLG